MFTAFLFSVTECSGRSGVREERLIWFMVHRIQGDSGGVVAAVFALEGWGREAAVPTSLSGLGAQLRWVLWFTRLTLGPRDGAAHIPRVSSLC